MLQVVAFRRVLLSILSVFELFFKPVPQSDDLYGRVIVSCNLSVGVSVDGSHCVSPATSWPLVQVVIHFRRDEWTDGVTFPPSSLLLS